MSTALYRRYRPETFAEVIGQEHVTVPLCAALAKDRVNHAYLFSGPRGCGKTTSARILARCLNCEQGPTPTPCGTCPSCVDLARGGPGSLDVVEIDAASHGGVDDARSLRERAAFAPARDRYKVFIIDEAHMVSTQGFNALLKIVEEPPPHVRFVFATTEPEKVIGTIRSRTHHYPFRLVPPERLASYLAELCQAEGVPVGQGVLPLVVRAGAGSVRDSLSVLDQLIAGTGDEGLTYQLAVSLLGYTDAALLDEVIDGLAAGDGRAVFGVIDRVIESGHDPRRFVEDLLERMRDLLVVSAVPDGGHGVLRGLPADQFERMKGQAARFGRAELSRSADVVNTALTEMTGATSPRLQLELLAARLLLPGSEDTERGLRARVDRIEKRIGVVAPGAPLSSPVSRVPTEAVSQASAPASAPVSTPVSTPVDVRASPPAVDVRASSAAAVSSAGAASAPPASPRQGRAGGPPAPVRSEPAVSAPAPSPARPAASAPSAQPRSAAAAGGDIETVRRSWPDVLDKLRALRRMTWTLVSEYAQVLDRDGDRLLLLFDSQGRAASFGRGSHAEYVRQALIDVIGLDCRIEAVAGDSAQIKAATAGPAQPPPTAQPPAAPVTQPPAAPVAQPPGAGQPLAVGQPPQRSTPEAPPTSATAAAAQPMAEPPGWGAPADDARGRGSTRPASTQPNGARQDGARADQSRQAPGRRATPSPNPAPARPHRSGPEPAGRPAPTRPGAGRSAGGRAVPPSADDIPLPPEPPSDEPPPEDDFDPYARPIGPLRAERPERPNPPPSRVDLTTGGRREPASGSGPSRGSGSAPTPGPGNATATSRFAALRAAAPVAERDDVPTVVRDDEPSVDDPDIEDSGLVGPQVVAQLLGGRVIEERPE